MIEQTELTSSATFFKNEVELQLQIKWILCG